MGLIQLSFDDLPIDAEIPLDKINRREGGGGGGGTIGSSRTRCSIYSTSTLKGELTELRLTRRA